MLGSPILETAIGLVLVYLLFSLLISALNEVVLGQLAHLRALVLEDGLKAIISDAGQRASPGKDFLFIIGEVLKSVGGLFYQRNAPPAPPAPPATAVQPAAAAQPAAVAPAAANVTCLAAAVIDHPLIRGLASGGRGCPGYLHSATFADAMLGTLTALQSSAGTAATTNLGRLNAAIASLGDANAKQVLQSLLLDADTLDEARQRIENWFNNSMERVSGLYKRYMQFWLLLWAALVVIALNVDSIDLSKRLLTDAKFRETLSTAATDMVRRHDTNSPAGTPPGPTVTEIQAEISRLNLPIGWGNCDASEWCAPRILLKLFPKLTVGDPGVGGSAPPLFAGLTLSPPSCPQTAADWWLKLAGLLVTIAALSQGAPFWFDLLNKLTNLRASGKPPKTDKADS